MNSSRSSFGRMSQGEAGRGKGQQGGFSGGRSTGGSRGGESRGRSEDFRGGSRGGESRGRSEDFRGGSRSGESRGRSEDVRGGSRSGESRSRSEDFRGGSRGGESRGRSEDFRGGSRGGESRSRSNDFRSGGRGESRGRQSDFRGGRREGNSNRRPAPRRDSDRDHNNSTPAEFIVGRRAVNEAIKGKRPINKLLVQDGLIQGSLGDMIAEVKDQGAVVQTVSRQRLDEISGNAAHQGLLAYIAAKNYVELDELLVKSKTQKAALILVLDGIVDPQNFGAILRSADGAGAVGVVIPKRRAVPLTGAVAKSSAGAIEHVPVARVANLSQAITSLKDSGFWIVGADASAEQNYWQMDLTGPIAFVIGSEGNGISRLVAEHCDFLVKLPMKGEISSLNAGVAAAVLLYEAIRQRS